MRIIDALVTHRLSRTHREMTNFILPHFLSMGTVGIFSKDMDFIIGCIVNLYGACITLNVFSILSIVAVQHERGPRKPRLKDSLMAERSAHHFSAMGCLANNNNNNNNTIGHNGSPTSQPIVTSTGGGIKSVGNPSVSSPSPPPPTLPTSTTPSFPSPHLSILLHHPAPPLAAPSVAALKGSDPVGSLSVNTSVSSSTSLSNSYLLSAAVQHLPALQLWPTLHLQESGKNHQLNNTVKITMTN